MSLSRNSYAELYNSIQNVLVVYGISSQRTDVVEETFLKIAGIEEEPEGCRWQQNLALGLDVAIFSFTISQDSAQKFLLYLKKFSGLEAEDITNIASKYKLDTEINNTPAIIIKMNCDAVRIHLVPLLAAYLKDNAHVVDHYLGLSYSFEVLIEKFDGIFIPEGIDFQRSGCFEDTLWKMIKASSGPVNTIRAVLTNMPNTLLDLVFDYMELRSYPTQLPEVRMLGSLLTPNLANSYSTDLTLTYNSQQCDVEKIVVHYLNGIIPRSAKCVTLDDSKSNSGVQTKVINAPNKTWLHPNNLFAIKTTLTNYSQAELDSYRQKSGTISKTTGFGILELKKLAKYLQEDKANCERKSIATLILALNEFITLIDKHELKDVSTTEFEKLRGKVQDQVLAIFDEELEKPQKSKHNSGFFHPSASLETVLKLIQTTVKEIERIMTKRFTTTFWF